MPLTQTDGRDNTTTYTLVSNRCLISTVTQPVVDDGTTSSSSLVAPVTTYTWNSFGQLLTRLDPTGREVRNSYDAEHYLETVTVENGASDIVTTFDRNAAGDITSVTDPLGRVHTGTYDTSRRLTRYDGPSGTGAATEWRYNIDGLIDRIRQATGNSAPNDWSTTTYTYWRAGRPHTMTDPDGGVTTYIFDDLNRPFAVIDPEERRSETIYDAEGQVLEEHRAVGTALAQIYATRAWTPNGLLDWVQDANDNRSDLRYDGFDRLDRLYFPVETIGEEEASTDDFEDYGYDPNGNRVSLRLRSGETISYDYDALNREIFKNIPDGTDADVTSRYDLAGRRTFARFGSSLTPSSDCTANNTGIDYCYDAVGRLQYETSYGRRLAFQYDAASNRTRITFEADSNYISYDYDTLNRVTHVRENGASSGAGVLAAYTYDPMSRRVMLTRGNGVNTDYGYTAASRLSLLHHNFADDANDANWAFQYTDAGHVSSRTWVQAYEWPVAALDENYEANGLNQYTEVDSAAFNYDSGGNLISDGSRNFSYDYENRLLTASGAVSGTLSYDPLGRLRSYTTGGTTTEFLYDGDRLIAEYVSGSIARRYAHGPGVDEPLVWYEGSGLTDRRWLIADRQGSIVATTDSGGAGTVYRYGPYGEPESWSGPRFRYTGQAVLSELQLYHYKARVYDPNLGRFLQIDPVGYEDDLNLYQYAFNDPLNLSDPGGTDVRGGCVGGGRMGSPLCIPLLQSRGGGASGGGAVTWEQRMEQIFRRIVGTPESRAEGLRGAIEDWQTTAENMNEITSPFFNSPEGIIFGIIYDPSPVGEARAVSMAAESVVDFLGVGARVVRNDSDAFVALSDDGLRRFRMDLTGHGDRPHFHLETRSSPTGRFRDATREHRNYFREE